MKYKLFALIPVVVLTLSLAGWTQDAPGASPAPNSTVAPEAQASCHHNMADMKDGKGCCHHAAADAKDSAGCCGDNKCDAKNGKSCCEAKDMKAAMTKCKKNGCCTEAKCCADGKSCGKDNADRAAMGCCGNKCERHPQTPAKS